MRPRLDEKGAIMMLAMAVMLALLFLAAASSTFSRGEQRITVNLRDATRALFIAEAGIEWVHNRARGDDVALYFDPSASRLPTIRPFGEGAFTVQVSSRDSSGRRLVTSLGNYLGTARSISATLRQFFLDSLGSGDCFLPGDADGDGVCDSKLGIASNQSVSLYGGSQVDSYHGGVAGYTTSSAKAHGNVATNGDLILLGAGTLIQGGIYVGRSLASGTNTVAQPKVNLPTVFLPPLPAFADVCGGHSNRSLVDCNPPFGTVTTVLAGSPPDQTLTISSGQTICMPPGAYCFRQIVVRPGGTLRFIDNPPSRGTLSDPVTVQLEGPASGNALDIEGRVEYGAGARPNLMKVFARGDIEIDGWSGASIYGLFYAPRSNIKLNANSSSNVTSFFGALAADKIELDSGPVRIHVDEDAQFGDFCGDGANPTCKPAFVIRDEWRENRS